METFRELLEDLKDAHAAHRSAFQKTRTGLGTNKKAQKAYKTREELLKALHEKLKFFYQTVLGPLEAPFLAGDSTAINNVLNFLEADVPAFRTGYSKEWYYRKLKAMKLDTDQVERLKNIAVKRCANPDYRREDRDLRRLMIRLADVNFLQKVAELPESSNPYVRRKKSLMFRVVLGGRKDLREEIETAITSKPSTAPTR